MSDALPLTYAWDFDDGAEEFGERVAHTFATSGEHAAKLTIYDADGASSDAWTVVVDAVEGHRYYFDGRAAGAAAAAAYVATAVTLTPADFLTARYDEEQAATLAHGSDHIWLETGMRWGGDWDGSLRPAPITGYDEPAMLAPRSRVRLLVSKYAGHPDCRPEWLP